MTIRPILRAARKAGYPGYPRRSFYFFESMTTLFVFITFAICLIAAGLLATRLGVWIGTELATWWVKR